ncbi:MAG: hypothetical protein IT373_30950, partial [Polyangiaceae bacterium]|nr:hypothetical protein [Polyangiaceae bacterium]
MTPGARGTGPRGPGRYDAGARPRPARAPRGAPPEPTPAPSALARLWPWLVLVLAVAVGVYLVFFRQNEASRVRARLEALAQALEVHGPDESFVLRAARIRQTVHEVIDKRASLQIADLADGKPDRTTLIELAGQAPGVYSQARIDLGDLTIELDQAETSAHVHGTVTFTGRRHG